MSTRARLSARRRLAGELPVGHGQAGAREARHAAQHHHAGHPAAGDAQPHCQLLCGSVRQPGRNAAMHRLRAPHARQRLLHGTRTTAVVLTTACSLRHACFLCNLLQVTPPSNTSRPPCDAVSVGPDTLAMSHKPLEQDSEQVVPECLGLRRRLRRRCTWSLRQWQSTLQFEAQSVSRNSGQIMDCACSC